MIYKLVIKQYFKTLFFQQVYSTTSYTSRPLKFLQQPTGVTHTSCDPYQTAWPGRGAVLFSVTSGSCSPAGAACRHQKTGPAGSEQVQAPD